MSKKVIPNNDKSSGSDKKHFLTTDFLFEVILKAATDSSFNDE